MWFGDSAYWLFGPLIFSLFSGLWLKLFVLDAWTGRSVLLPGSLRGRKPEDKSPPKRAAIHASVSFFGLFWMTAPVAWLYAIPVERWCDEVEAAKWNLRLLGVVALWRVLLMSRVVSVIGKWPFLYSFGRVLLPAAMEAGALTMVGKMISRNLMAAMAGLRMSPAERVLDEGYDFVLSAVFPVFLGAVLIVAIYSLRGRVKTSQWKPVPSTGGDKMPWLFLLIVAGLWTGVSLPAQQEQKLSREAKELAAEKNWAGLLTFLSKHEKSDFSPSRALPPAIFEAGITGELPDLFAGMSSQTAPWVRSHYLQRLGRLLSMADYRKRFNYVEAGRLVTSLGGLEEGPAFAKEHESLLREILESPLKDGDRTDGGEKEVYDRAHIVLEELLKKAGGAPP
jgi:hypothetical protein